MLKLLPLKNNKQRELHPATSFFFFFPSKLSFLKDCDGLSVFSSASVFCHCLCWNCPTKNTHGLLQLNPQPVFNPGLISALLGSTGPWSCCSLPKRLSLGSTDMAHSGFSSFPAVASAWPLCGPPLARASFKCGCFQCIPFSPRLHILMHETLPLPWFCWSSRKRMAPKSI